MNVNVYVKHEACLSLVQINFLACEKLLGDGGWGVWPRFLGSYGALGLVLCANNVFSEGGC